VEGCIYVCGYELLKPAQNKMKIDHEAQNAKVMDADGKTCLLHPSY
jgi:hypothetical protein